MRHVAALASILLALVTPALAASDLTRAGKLEVGVTTVTALDTSRGNRALPTEIWYPARRAGRDATPLPRKYPLVIVAHGLCGSRLYYDYLAPHLASWGFIVAAPDFTGFTRADCDAGPPTASFDDLPIDLSFVCRELHDVAGPLGTWAQHVRGIPTALVGNSLGGLAAVGAVRIYASFTAIVGLAAAAPPSLAPELADLHRAWMMMGATGDDTVRFTQFTEPFFEQLTAPSFLVRFTGGSHTGFSDENPDTEPDPRQAQHDTAKRYATPFLLKYLAQKNKFGRRLRATDDGVAALIARPK
jgi:alpha-beta hydrolase superfamily lysophospholipase